ncbi:DTW domain-containing protein [Thalassotalea euphylliae]|uniref:tRNA-uridine aminocarboxypropyltransferase n=1 Tax=Thalassotalea euphylliae TaxID=1655234 RepID=A0A3E0TT14_9GAMM|nr:DTW domain-containing protein [Thalassotalea euphylliae]REL27560.1 DTW domain-containing protein [Thalassotalea euphylliae]
MNHSVQQLYCYRKSISTKPFNARGKKVQRCERCQLAEVNCICALRTSATTEANFVIMMHDAEVLKPSNTARLIADVVPNTQAFIWSRTEPNPALLKLLADPQYFPVVIFPAQYAAEPRTVLINQMPDLTQSEFTQGKTPLFILLDGSWREAKRMFRKSPYLDKFPVLSITGASDEQMGNYIREAEVENQFSTAQVAAQVLALNGEAKAAQHLFLWFDLFNFQYQKSVCQRNQGRSDAQARYQAYLARRAQQSEAKE